MSKSIKKINQTIATFMLVSCALSGPSLAKINEDLLINKAESATPAVKIANNMPTMGSVNPTPMLLYGVPNDIPTVTPVVPPALLYGVPSNIPTVTPIVVPRELYAPPSNMPTVNPINPTKELYGVPVNPTKELYGVPVNPGLIQPLYAVPVNPSPIVQPAYAVPVTPGPIAQPLYAVPNNPTSAIPANTEAANQQIYNASSRNAEVNLGSPAPTGQSNRDKDARVPVNYVAPIIIPRYYIMDQK